MVKSIVAFIAASAAVVHEEPLSCSPVVRGCPTDWTKENEVEYKEDEARRKQAVSRTLESQRLRELGTKLVATGNDLKDGLEKLQQSEEIAKAIKGPPTNCFFDVDEDEDDEDDEDDDFGGWFDDVIQMQSSSSKKKDDLLARADSHFKDLDIEGMRSKFQAISAGVDEPDDKDDKKMHELLVIFTDANVALKRIHHSLSKLPNTIKMSSLFRLQKDASFMSDMTADNTSDFDQSNFHEYACRIGMVKAEAGKVWALTNKWDTLKKTNGEMIQKYKAALKVVKEYVAKIAVAIKSTNTMIGKLMSARPQARFSLAATADGPAGAQTVSLKQRSFLAIDRE